ncbi:MAG: 5'-methylthioadenosine/S-adenosylhomocysteine nucleosidase, partial [Alphaproteobacteria bacterium]|nr:5'-methylthioadenosine/S-adenosylhomocysteine nucleosidase [Alphaproteobacteria bacterium]
EPEKLQATKANFPQALAVDMESTAIAQSCFHYKCPLIVTRQISDIVGQHNQKEIYEKFWQDAPKQASELLQKLLTQLTNLA